MRWRSAYRLALALAVASMPAYVAAQQQRPRAPAAPVQPAPPPPPPPELPLVYEPQLLRLAETLGVIAYMAELCGEPGADAWRIRAEQLIEAEAATQARKERLAGAYNRGYAGHQPLHRTCNDRSRLVLSRMLGEAREVTQDISNRYGG